MSHKKLKFRFSLILVLVALLLQVTPAFAEGNANPGVLPPDAHPFGKTYAEWSNAWWQWAFSIPLPENPLLDPTGAKCGVAQSGKVFFLAGTTGSANVSRTCTIPQGKALFFPILNYEDDILFWNTTAEVINSCNNVIAGIDAVRDTMIASIDGVTVKSLTTYRVGENGPLFSVTIPADNLETYNGAQNALPGTYYPACSVGYYLMLAPLPPGKHTLQFAGGSSAFHLDVTYHLTIKG